jgi:hypothetical protein
MAAPKTAPANQNAEQLPPKPIDAQVTASGWIVQSRAGLNFNSGPAIAVREYTIDAGPADYVLFLNQQPIGIAEAKPEDWGTNCSMSTPKPKVCAAAKLNGSPTKNLSPSSTKQPASSSASPTSATSATPTPLPRSLLLRPPRNPRRMARP